MVVVAVTGASGFIGSHIVDALLKRGHVVRATVRDTDDIEKTRHLTDLMSPEQIGAELGGDAYGKLELWKADLLGECDFDEVFQGCDVVVHAAAVVSNASAVKDPIKEIVDPSIKGTENVIKSVVKSGTVKRVIHTSSIAAIQTYDKPDDFVFSESDWNDWSSKANGDFYGIAKVEAEKVMREAGEQHGFEVIAINPAVVFGPCMTKAHTKASPVFIRQLLYGNEQPDVSFTWVDVREVAEAHSIAVEASSDLSGRRFIIAGDHDSHFARFPKLAADCAAVAPSLKIQANMISGLLYNLAWYTKMSEFEKAVIKCNIRLSNESSKTDLGIKYRPASETLKDTIDSMVETGFVKARSK